VCTVPAGPRPVPAPPPLDAWAIRHSLESLTAGAQRAAGDFYGYLFVSCPQLREMFPPVMAPQNERLFNAIVKIVSLLDAPDRLARYLTQLGADHRKYGVQPEHYMPVGDSLLRALRRHCGGWDDRAEAAWAGAYTVASDAMIAGAAASSGPPWWQARVVRHEMRTRDVAVLEVETAEPIDYEPGQYVTVQTGKWPNVWRQFSVASAPSPDGCHFQLHVRRVPNGWVSTALTRDIPDGGEIIIGPPVGDMTTESAGERDLLLVAGGVGLAPMKAMAEDILARDESALRGGWGFRRNVCLFHGATDPLGLYEKPYLHEMEQTWPWFQAVPVVSGEGRFTGLKGNVSEAVGEYADWSDREAYLAGPAEMISATAATLSKGGLPEDRVHFDEPSVRR
jgi:NAD(P)H-flavin reductase/hemoglobin-like flavoprotein